MSGRKENEKQSRFRKSDIRKGKATKDRSFGDTMKKKTRE